MTEWTKNIPDVLGAQARFSKTQQVFSSVSTQKTNLFYFETFFSKSNICSFKNVGDTHNKDKKNAEILPVAFIDSRLKIKIVFCSKLVFYMQQM